MNNTASGTAIAAAFLQDPKLTEVARFLAAEGAALIDLLGSLGEVDAVDAMRRAMRLSAIQAPDLLEIRKELTQALEGLQNVPLAIVDDLAFACLCPQDAHTAIRWYGARMTDLIGMLRAA